MDAAGRRFGFNKNGGLCFLNADCYVPARHENTIARDYLRRGSSGWNRRPWIPAPD
jgi:hypothetical protein